MSYPNLPNQNQYPPQQSYQPQPPQQQQQPEYAPPLHSLPTTSRAPPVYAPSCIPNPSRVNYGFPAVIKCGRNNLVLMVNQVSPNCPVTIWTNNGTLQQKWWFTKEGRIELAADRTYCLDCINVQVGAQVVLGKKRLSQTGDEVDPAIISQKWNVVSHGNVNYIVSVKNPNFVLELAGSTQNYLKGDLVRINSNLNVNNLHQTWYILPVQHTSTSEDKLVAWDTRVYIYSADTGLYLTVKTGIVPKAKAGASIVWSKGKVLAGAKSQQWVFHDEGFISSALDKNGNLVLDCQTGQAGQELILNNKQYTNNLSQKWIIKQCTGQSDNKDLNLKVCRYLYSQLNTNVVIDEKGKDEAAFVNFCQQNFTGAQKVKFKTA